MSEPTIPSISARGADSSKWRQPTAVESDVMKRLLSVDFPGRDIISAQFATARVMSIDDNGSLRFLVVHEGIARVNRRIPVEAEVNDEDGVAIHVLLHIVDGRIDELEVYRDDSLAVISPIQPNRLRVILL